MTIYKSMGALAHEKQPVYTFDRPASEVYDALDVLIPDGWSLDVNQAGETLVTDPDGKTYLGSEILGNWGDAPAFRWYDGHTDRRIILKEEKNMKKYEIYTESFELRFGTSESSIPTMSADEVWDSYMAQSCHEPRLEATYDTLEEAQEAFRAYRVSTRAEASSVFWLLVGDVAYIQESMYDDADEYDQGCIYDYAAEAYTSVEDR